VQAVTVVPESRRAAGHSIAVTILFSRLQNGLLNGTNYQRRAALLHQHCGGFVV